MLSLFFFSFLGPLPVYVVCHHGNDSQKAVPLLQKHFSSQSKLSIIVKDISSGLSGWTRTVDPTFPEYWNHFYLCIELFVSANEFWNLVHSWIGYTVYTPGVSFLLIGASCNIKLCAKCGEHTTNDRTIKGKKANTLTVRCMVQRKTHYWQ